MSQEEQGKKTSPVISDAAVKEVIPAKPGKPAALSDADLDNVAGGISDIGERNLAHGFLDRMATGLSLIHI